MDAFRYEMGKCFADSMMRNEPKQVKIGAKLSFLPSVTRFGMAAHLGHVKVVEQNGKLQPSVDGRVIITPDDRLDYLQQKTHVIMQDVRLENFDMSAIEDNVQLLVIRSQDMDTAGEEIKLSGLAVMDKVLVRLARTLNACKQKALIWLSLLLTMDLWCSQVSMWVI